jgi:CRISPR-associated protein Csb2
MSLVLEIEHLLGIAFAARSAADSTPDWPPQPDRVFSALVAAWGAHDKPANEREALQWLERQLVPEIIASGGFERTTATVFVPPNDPESGRVANRSVMPEFRSRQPRRFPAYRPHDPFVRLVWPDAVADEITMLALNALAVDVPYIGHSASLTRCRFSTDVAAGCGGRARRRVYEGRLSELERAYDAGRRPGPGEDVPIELALQSKTKRSAFADRWLILEHLGGQMPDLRAAPLVSKALRRTLMSGYKAIGREEAIPQSVSGHAPDGSPSSDPHLAIVPLAFLGSRHADGRVFGFALIPPVEGELLDDAEFQNALREIARWKSDVARREVQLIGDGFNLTFSLSSEHTRRSLDPEPYLTAARTWATCTPIVLDRHLKAKGNAARDQEMCEMVSRACHRVGLPKPALIAAHDSPAHQNGPAIAVSKHSAIGGAPSAFPSGRAPRWTGWRLPESLASRQLTHAVVQFPEPVRGPVLLGAGRFVGLGLCRAHDGETQ